MGHFEVTQTLKVKLNRKLQNKKLLNAKQQYKPIENIAMYGDIYTTSLLCYLLMTTVYWK